MSKSRREPRDEHTPPEPASLLATLAPDTPSGVLADFLRDHGVPEDGVLAALAVHYGVLVPDDADQVHGLRERQIARLDGEAQATVRGLAASVWDEVNEEVLRAAEYIHTDYGVSDRRLRRGIVELLTIWEEEHEEMNMPAVSEVIGGVVTRAVGFAQDEHPEWAAAIRSAAESWWYLHHLHEVRVRSNPWFAA